MAEPQIPAHLMRIGRSFAQTYQPVLEFDGQADLIVFAGQERPTDGYVFAMELNVAYDIPKLIWHWVVMSPDAHIILVERSGTNIENSEFAELPAGQVAEIARQFSRF